MIRFIVCGILMVGIVKAIELFVYSYFYEKKIDEFQKNYIELQKEYEEWYQHHLHTLIEYNQRTESVSTLLLANEEVLKVKWKHLLCCSQALTEKINNLNQSFSAFSKAKSCIKTQDLIIHLNQDIALFGEKNE